MSTATGGTATDDRLAIAREELAKVTARTSTRLVTTEPVISDQDRLPVDTALRELLPHAGLRAAENLTRTSSPLTSWRESVQRDRDG